MRFLLPSRRLAERIISRLKLEEAVMKSFPSKRIGIRLLRASTDRSSARFTVAMCAVSLLVLLSGCTVGPKYHPAVTQAPAVYKESPTQFKENEGWTVAQPSDAKLRGKSWEIFNEP